MKPPKRTELAFGELIDEVLRLAGRVATANGAMAATVDLTSAQHLVLTAVVNAPRPPTVPQIGRSLGHSRQAVQRIADHLEQRTLIMYADNPDHRVARLLLPTVAGRRAHAAVHELSRGWVSDATTGTTDAEIIDATATLRALRKRIEQRERSH